VGKIFTSDRDDFRTEFIFGSSVSNRFDGNFDFSGATITGDYRQVA